MNRLWKFNYLCKIFIIFLCLGVISGIVFYFTAKAETINTSVTITVCGNGIVDLGEECDDGNSSNTDICLNTCVDASCGDGYIQSGIEQCDDGNIISGDGCSSSCQTEAPIICGDGTCNGAETCSSCPVDCGTCHPSGGGGGGGGGTTPPININTKVIIQGKAYPATYVTVLKDGQVIGNTQANAEADFKFEISNITPGIYTFGIWAEDANGLKSITFSFTTNVASGTITTISGIFIPPTIDLDRDSVKRGETLNISGQTAPRAEVEIQVNSESLVEKATATAVGDWFYNLDTNRIEEGVHGVRAKASTINGLVSTFSQIKLFGVGVSLPNQQLIRNTDLNKDERVNLIDFSILLYNWGAPQNPDSDLNSDGKVDLIDFSIMLYWWSG